MRGSVISSSFRRISRGLQSKSSNGLGPSAAAAYAAAKRFGWSKRGISTCEEKMRLKLRQEEWACPVKYFKEEVKLLDSLDDNELIEAVGGRRGVSLIAWKAGKAIRSLPELIAKHHARGDTVGRALRLDNLGISKSEGKFGFLDTSAIGPAVEPGSLQKDWQLGGDVLAAIAERVLGDTPWPKDLSRYVKLVRSASPKNFRQIFYNSLFLAPRARYWLRVFMDQRFRKDGDSLPRDTKHRVQKFLGKLRYQYGGPEVEGSLLWIARKNEIVAGAMGEARVEAQMRRRNEKKKNKQEVGEENKQEVPEDKAKEVAITEEEKWRRDTGRWVVGVNRDVYTHGTTTKRMYLKKVKWGMLTAENIWPMLHIEFEDLDQMYIELCDEDNLLWELLGIWEVFFETPDTWERAREALQKDMDREQALAQALAP